jgi:hypothetical protein
LVGGRSKVSCCEADVASAARGRRYIQCRTCSSHRGASASFTSLLFCLAQSIRIAFSSLPHVFVPRHHNHCLCAGLPPHHRRCVIAAGCGQQRPTEFPVTRATFPDGKSRRLGSDGHTAQQPQRCSIREPTQTQHRSHCQQTQQTSGRRP